MSGNMTNVEHPFFYHLNNKLLAVPIGALAVILPLVTLLIKLALRPRLVVPVNCWFCNTNSRVASAEANSWYCPHCHQYNGFLPDGDYNKDIPEQRFGGSNTFFTSLSKSKVSPNSNGLCDRCNDNQEMKVMHLAAFQAAIPSNYQEELSIYCNQLENAYRLCQKCENIVTETLERKKSLVLGMQLQQSEKRIMGTQKYFKYWEMGLHRVVTVVAVTLCILTVVPRPIIHKVDFPMLNGIREQVKANYWAVLIGNFSLQLVLTVCTGRKLPLVVCGAHLGVYLWGEQWASVEDYSYALSFLSGLTLILTLCSKKTRTSAFVKLKKIEKSSRNTKPAEAKVTEAKAAVKASPAVLRSSVQLESKAFPVKLEQEISERSAAMAQDDTSSVDSAFSNHDSLTQDSDSDVKRRRGDVNSLIQSLSEWNSGVEERVRVTSRHEFQPRQYTAVLKPPRLVSTSPKSVNESSWVAGGFWHNHQNETENIARPGSPNPSVHSQASSSWHTSSTLFEPRPYPMYVPFGAPNGFQQPFGFQPYMYPSASVVNPTWSLFHHLPSCPTSPTTPSSCSSASTCGSVRRRHCDEPDSFSDVTSKERSHLFQTFRRNGSVILYTSAFYVALSAVALFFYQKW